MADIKMGRFEISEYELPDVCMQCGARARQCPLHTFTWTPGWVYAFFVLGPIGIIVIRILINSVRQEFTMGVPLCAAHQGHWFWRGLIVVLLFLGFGAALMGGVVLAGALDEPWAFFLTFLSALFSFLLAVILVQRTAIRAREITPQSVTLTGVSDEFVAALNEDRRGERERAEEDPDDERRSSRRGRRDQDEERRSRRPLPPADRRPSRRGPDDAIERREEDSDF